MQSHYPSNWAAISARVRFTIAHGRCTKCQRPHMQFVPVLADGRWFDGEGAVWRNSRGQEALWPDLLEAVKLRYCRVVLSAAHRDGNPRNNRWRNLVALCQRCHLAHDQVRNARQRHLTIRARYASADLFEDAPTSLLAKHAATAPAKRSAATADDRRRLTAWPALPLLSCVPWPTITEREAVSHGME